jgi:hypothetical protein
MPRGRQIPECTQKHHRTIKREELFLTLYNATLFKLHLTTCCHSSSVFRKYSTNFQIYWSAEYPSCVSNHILELIQISFTKVQNINVSPQSKTTDLLFIQVHYQEFLGVTYCQIESRSQLANTKSLLLQYIFSGGVHYCLNDYTCYKIRFHLLYDVLVVFDYLKSRHLPPDY